MCINNILYPFYNIDSTRKEGKIGKYSRVIGESTYAHTSKAKNWAEKEMRKHFNKKPVNDIPDNR
jgi:hypothetical protein